MPEEHQPSSPPTTTKEQDLKSAGNRESDALTAMGQRKVNLIWEITQATVAITVTVTTLAVSGYMSMQKEGSTPAFLLLSNVFFLIVGTYFNRTNHTKVGGVGPARRGE